jgi:diguanylate cyclase (GGDEF)-like protein/PAS domain S-box-containing protein
LHIMNKIEVISVVLVIIGAAFIFASFLPAQKAWKKVPEELRKRWLVIVYLMRFFFVGYIFFDIVLMSDFQFPIELVTGGVFFGGAIFVYIVINLSQHTITKVQETEWELKVLNEALEQRVTERTKELRRSYEFSQTVLNSMNDPISIIDVNTHRIIGINSAFLRDFGFREEEVVGKTCHEVTHRRSEPCKAPHDICPLVETMSTGGHASVEHVHFDHNGKKTHFEVITSPIKNEEGKIIQAVHVTRDITERKQAEEQIRFLAYYDNLTRLPNRTFYKELLTRALIYATRHKKTMAVLFVDLDSFKRVNDTLGHAVGDQLLQAVAERLLNATRKSDYVARSDDEDTINTVSRLGGDEFIVLLNEIVHAYDATVVARRILADLSKPFILGGNEVFVTASIGISLYPADGKEAETLLKNADIAMYSAKEHGKNNFQFYAETMNATAFERLTIENELRKALERGGLVLYYQPKVDISSRKIIGMEALLRWNHPVRGLVLPDEFLPLAEETGLIVPIGEWALRSACMQNKAWQTAGLRRIPISVNISRRQFEQQNLRENILKALQDAGLAANFLELEITESTIMPNPDKAASLLRALKAAGIKISIDSFGTGYSSLDQLRRMPLDFLKIDRSFIINISAKAEDADITRAIIALAHSLKLKVIAEGVETEEQFAFLRELGCNEARGYLFSKPVPAEECAQLISNATS